MGQLSEVNEKFFGALQAEGGVKKAADASTKWIRTTIIEESIIEKVLPHEQIGNAELDKQMDTDKPAVIVDKEPNSPGAVSLPFGQLPQNRYINGPRFRVLMSRIASRRLTKDVDELRTYDIDIRQILSDNSVKYIATEKDTKAFRSIDLMVDAANQLTATEAGAGSQDGSDLANACQIGAGLARAYKLVDANGITRESVGEATKSMPATVSAYEASTVVVNMLTIKDIAKWDRTEMGGDFSEEVLVNGWAERTLMGMRWIVTIKRNLVPNSVFYFFAEPKFLGKHYLLEDTTMWIKKEATMLEWYSYTTCGMSFANFNAITRVEIARTAA